VLGVTAFALSFVPPEVFDATLTGRMAVYPLCGAALLWAGRRGAGRLHSIAGLLIAGLPILWTAAAPIPKQSIPQAARWLSFGAMVAGISGLARGEGRRSLLSGLSAAGALAGLTVVVLGPDGAAGNPNRLGALLAVSVVACASAETGLRVWQRLVLGGISAAGLFLSGFYTGWIGAALGVGWLFSGGKRLRPIVPVSLLLAGQLALGLLPGPAGGIHPSLRLRTLIWRTGVDISAERFPLGSGTGQARLHLHAEGPEDLRSLAGEDRRIDHLHSELLTPPVEQGLAGLALIALFLVWIARAGKDGARGALLIAIWPVLAADLPLATPLGAVPVAAVLACCLPANGTVRLSGWLPAALGMLGLAWAASLILGYAELRSGRRAAQSGEQAEAARHMENACRLLPFEERCRLYLTASRMELDSPEAALDAAEEFNALYPRYWRGHQLEAGVLLSLGREEAAGRAFLSALRLAPADSARIQNRLALGALHHVTESPRDRTLLARRLLENVEIPVEMPPQACRDAAAALRRLADAMPPGEEARALRDYAMRFEDEADYRETADWAGAEGAPRPHRTLPR
jgi:tetratricopeptide (TPR) repeat protein